MKALRAWLAAHRPRSRYARLREELDALDRGLVATGLIAARAIERLDAQDEAWRSWRQVAGPDPRLAAHDAAFRPRRSAADLRMIRGGAS